MAKRSQGGLSTKICTTVDAPINPGEFTSRKVEGFAARHGGGIEAGARLTAKAGDCICAWAI